MASIGKGWRSIERTLPLLILGLQIATVTALTIAAYQRVEQILLVTAGQRLENASKSVVLLLAQSTARSKAVLGRAAADSALRTYLVTGRGAHAARAALATAWSGEPHPHGRIELRRADGTIALDTSLGAVPAGSGWLDRTIASGKLGSDTTALGPFTTAGDSTFSEMVVSIPAKPAQAGGPPMPAPLGYVADIRFLSTTGAQVVRDLIGGRVTLLLGSLSGGDWTDLEHPSPPPPPGVELDQPLIFASSPRGPGVGAAVAIQGTPWILWVEQPRASVLSPMHPLLSQLVLLAALFLAAGSLIAWLLGRRITKPIVALTAAAEQLASTGSPATPRTGQNEIGRLNEAFARMSARVRESHEELEARVASRTKELESFSYSVAHDLRAPLRSIDGFSQVMLEDHAAQLDEEGRKCLRFVREATQHMGHLIDALLELSRITRAEVRRESVDLSAIARDTVTRLERTAGDCPAEVQIADGLRAEGDPRLLRIVVDNLLGNAWKFSGKRQQPRVEVGALAANGRPRTYFVRDNGAGFDMAFASKLFGVFERLHSVSEFEGTGIGLAIVQRIIDRHGGRIWAEGAVDKGATFFFTLDTR
jgi:signal transduction histidine kinase